MGVFDRFFRREEKTKPSCPRCGAPEPVAGAIACPACGWDLREAYQGPQLVGAWPAKPMGEGRD